MEELLISMLVVSCIWLAFKDKFNTETIKDTRTQEQKDYDHFMEHSGGFDTDDEDIESNRRWRDKVYGK